MRACLIPLLAATACGAGAAETPNPATLRAQIDHLVSDRLADHQPATMGLLRDVIDLSLSYGGPAYDGGDHAAARTFYHATASKLVSSFTGPHAATDQATTQLHELSGALERDRDLKDVEHQAWTLRYAFDEVKLACSIDAGIAQAQIQVASSYFANGYYTEAELAFSRAWELVRDLAGMDINAVPANARLAGILHAQTLLELNRIPEAATDMAKAVLSLPEIVSANLDWHSLSPRDRGVADKALAAVAAAVAKDASDADLTFLLAVEQRFSGHPDDATKTLATVLTLAPGHPGAHLLSSGKPAAAAEPAKPPPPKPGTGGGAEVVP